MSNGDLIEFYDAGEYIVVETPPVVEYMDLFEVGPPINLGTISLQAHPDFAGLTVFFGPEPLPDPTSMPNTVYFVLPTQ